MKKRIIFDLDGTLLTGDWSHTDKYFADRYGDDAIPFTKNMNEILETYEKNHLKYDYDTLSGYLKGATGLDITPRDIIEWNLLVEEVKDILEDDVCDTLEYLKSQGASLVVLTNWFENTQSRRLERAGLLNYFDVVYGGDIYTKPHKEAYWIAAANYRPEECLFVGDSLDNDYIGPRACGMDSILYEKDINSGNILVKVKKLSELKDK